MPQKIQIQTTPEQASDQDLWKREAAKKLKIKESEITAVVLNRRSIDARQRNIKINIGLEVFINEPYVPKRIEKPVYQDVSKANPVIIVGAGPAGLFAALECLESGLKPIVVERGKDVRARRRDLAAITKDHIVNPDSNYCFGEGGAGTYSDGKLYTRAKKRGDVLKVLELLVAHGANEDILINAHPHIGTNKLPDIIASIRETILAHGGEIHFNARVKDLLIHKGRIEGVKVLDGAAFKSNQVILATGHSARDIFKLLHRKGLRVEVKPFALGVRVEHTQELIDKIQYKCELRGEHLPPAPYSVVKQVNGRGVYSFCMCPGGIIAPCATEPEEVVTNGWSPSKRDFPTANSGIVVELKTEDFAKFKDKGPLAGMYFQSSIEKKAWELAGKTQKVPAQRLYDFIDGVKSYGLPKTSYHPGIVSVNLSEVLPSFIVKALIEAFEQFEKSMPGYLTNDAIVHAPESRTSSPVRIPRDPQTLEHPEVKGLYPCGEGGGYAGGIMSAAMDGIRCVQALEK